MNILAKFRRRKEIERPQREKWLSEIAEVKNELDSNEMLFNMTDDFNLTEYAIHKKAALESRYSYLMRLIRRYDECCANKTHDGNVMSEELMQKISSEKETSVEIL